MTSYAGEIRIHETPDDPVRSPETVIVGVGDCGIAKPPTAAIVTYALGSCIAVVAWDPKLKLGGLLHIMLPDSSIDPVRAAVNPWSYADTGVPALLNRLKTGASNPRQLRWSMAGGALMLGDAARFEIGKRNYLALKKIFWRLGVFIAQEDVGGKDSRTVKLDLLTGRIDVRNGMGSESILAPGLATPWERRTADARPAR